MPYPQKTGADTIVESDTAIFARESRARPFTFEAIETFKGQYDGDPIPLLLDTATARELALDPSVKVVLVQDRSGGNWARVGTGGSEYQAVVREVAQWQVRWNTDARTTAERATFFSRYLRDKDRTLAELAFLEVGRAPYATIRDLRATVERDDIYRVIRDFFHVEWHGLYILMLGMSDRDDDLAFVRGKLETAAKYGITINLGAYATAFIEMVGADAVNVLASEYFARPGRNSAELLEIVNALSVQGKDGRVEVRAAIVDAYGLLLERHPELAGYVADDLYDWKVTRFVPRLREILSAGVGLDGASQFAVALYLSSTDQGRSAVGFGPIPSGRLQ